VGFKLPVKAQLVQLTIRGGKPPPIEVSLYEHIYYNKMQTSLERWIKFNDQII
jgi:hypothetical protein